MANETVQMQARMYVYDLNNTAKEFGFKPDEGWELSVTTQDEKIVLEKRYHPILSAKVQADVSSELFGLVKNGLSQGAANIQNNIEHGIRNNNEQQYLVAFNPKRGRY